jgi:hypothetical protein
MSIATHQFMKLLIVAGYLAFAILTCIALYYGIVASRCQARMSRHLAPGLSWWKAYANPGSDDPGIVTEAGRQDHREYVRASRRMMIAAFLASPIWLALVFSR